jgi:TadE-like protein
MPHRAPPDAGQAAVEFVAVLPLVALVLALAWQAILAGHAVWAANTAARAAARAAAVGRDPTLAARAHLPTSLEPGLRISRPAGDAVELSLRIPPVLPALRLGRVTATGHFRPQEPAS